MGCKYIFSYMVTPETKHIAEKTGYITINQIIYDDKAFRRIILGDAESKEELTPE